MTFRTFLMQRVEGEKFNALGVCTENHIYCKGSGGSGEWVLSCTLGCNIATI